MSSLRLALKQSLQESSAAAATTTPRGGDGTTTPSDGASPAGGGTRGHPKAAAASSSSSPTQQHSAAHKIQSRWKSSSAAAGRSSSSGRDAAAAATSSARKGPRSPPVAAPDDPGEADAAATELPPPKKKKTKARDRPRPEPEEEGGQDNGDDNDDDDGSESRSAAAARTVPHPPAATVAWQRRMDVKQARRHVAPGLRVKVRFAMDTEEDADDADDTAAERAHASRRRWFGGRVSAVSKEGSKIRIKYDDGTTEVTRFPDKDVIVDDTGNGRHAVPVDKFLPPGPGAAAAGEGEERHSSRESGDEGQDEPPYGKYARSPKSSAPTDVAESTALSPPPDDGDKPVKRKRGRPPKQRTAAAVATDADAPDSLPPPPAAALPKPASPKSVPPSWSPGEPDAPEGEAAEESGGDGDQGAQEAATTGPPPSSALFETTATTPNAGSSSSGGMNQGATELPRVADPSDAAPPNAEDAFHEHVDSGDRSSPTAASHTGDGAGSDHHHPPKEMESIVDAAGGGSGAAAADGRIQSESLLPPGEQLSVDKAATGAPIDASDEMEAADEGDDKLMSSSNQEVEMPTEGSHIHVASHKMETLETGETNDAKAASRTDIPDKKDGPMEGSDDDADLASSQVPENEGAPISSETKAFDGTSKKRKRPLEELTSEREDSDATGAKRKIAKSDHVENDLASHSDGGTGEGGALGVDKSAASASKEIEHAPMKVDIPVMEENEVANILETASPRSRVSELDKLGVLDASIVRSGRRAAQQANERITSRQELVIDAVDDRKGKKKRKREADDNNSEASEPDSQWVQCDSCSKWRIIPSAVVETLPKQWYCADNLWDPKRASCEAPEQTQKQVAKEKRRRKKLQQRLRMEAEVAAAAENGEAGVSSSRLPTPDLDESTEKSNRASTEDMVDEKLFVEKDKKQAAVAVNIKKRPESTEPTVPVDASVSDAQARRGRGRPRRVKETSKPVVDPEPIPQSHQSVAEATDETQNLEWVQCEHCQKWRKLPSHISADDLPDVWYCSMNTWNVASASCDAPEDKADGLQDIGFNSGSGSGKLSYRNLIFGNTGRKPSRPISERARAAESLFLAPNEDEDAPPIVMYANSSAFVARKKGNPNLIPDENEGNSVLDLMSHSNLWAELRAASQPFFQLGATDKPNRLVSYTYDTLPPAIQVATKALLLNVLGDRSLTADEILAEARDGSSGPTTTTTTTTTTTDNSDNDDNSRARALAFCDLNVVVTTLFELVKEGAVECVQKMGLHWPLKDWIAPRYRVTRVHRPTPVLDDATAAAAGDAMAKEPEPVVVEPKPSRFMKISKPWKQR